jgi:flagellar basal body P-ring protein FlgI
MITITQKDYTILQKIAEKINSEIKAYNEAHDVVHQVISVSVSQDDDFIDHYAYFDIETFKTHSSDEESYVHDAIRGIARQLTDALITDTIVSSGDGIFTAVYKLI